MAEFIFTAVIISFVALVMMVIGIAQIKSKEPVGFYTGEKPIPKEQLKDMVAWNKKHGAMWIWYGVAIIVSFVISSMINHAVWSSVILIGVIAGALPVMMWYHSRFKKEYMR